MPDQEFRINRYKMNCNTLLKGDDNDFFLNTNFDLYDLRLMGMARTHILTVAGVWLSILAHGHVSIGSLKCPKI